MLGGIFFGLLLALVFYTTCGYKLTESQPHSPDPAPPAGSTPPAGDSR
jgi:hypothetical protein